MMANDTADPSDDFIAILGSVANGPRAGYPQVTIPMGYNDDPAAHAQRHRSTPTRTRSATCSASRT